jgi:hypothetical protein
MAAKGVLLSDLMALIKRKQPKFNPRPLTYKEAKARKESNGQAHEQKP